MKLGKQQIATIIALAFHVSAFIAIGVFRPPIFLWLTPLNLLVCALLIFWTQEKIGIGFLLFFLAAVGIGFFAGWVGTHTGLLFGEYSYGKVMGPLWQGVPCMLGVQWFIVIYCSGICMAMLHQRLVSNQPEAYKKFPGIWLTLSMIADSALLALFFDWILEPVAMKLGYWKWADGEVPWSNYASWWGVSAVIMIFFLVLPFKKQNLFALHLIMMQVMYFLLLNMVLM